MQNAPANCFARMSYFLDGFNEFYFIYFTSQKMGRSSNISSDTRVRLLLYFLLAEDGKNTIINNWVRERTL